MSEVETCLCLQSNSSSFNFITLCSTNAILEVCCICEFSSSVEVDSWCSARIRNVAGGRSSGEGDRWMFTIRLDGVRRIPRIILIPFLPRVLMLYFDFLCLGLCSFVAGSSAFDVDADLLWVNAVEVGGFQQQLREVVHFDVKNFCIAL